MERSRIYLGRVIDVDVNNYTVDVELNNGSNIGKIQVATSFFNTRDGDGIIGHPDKDSLCIVAKIDNGEYVILGFIAAVDQLRDGNDDVDASDTGYRSSRPLWLPGDFGLASKYGGFIRQESSGNIHLKASHLSQMWLVPDPANMLKLITDNLEFEVGYNKFKLVNNRVRNSSDFTFLIRPTANNSSSSNEDIEISIGKSANSFTISIGGDTVIHIDPQKTVTVNNNLIVYK